MAAGTHADEDLVHGRSEQVVPSFDSCGLVSDKMAALRTARRVSGDLSIVAKYKEKTQTDTPNTLQTPPRTSTVYTAHEQKPDQTLTKTLLSSMIGYPSVPSLDKRWAVSSWPSDLVAWITAWRI